MVIENINYKEGYVKMIKELIIMVGLPGSSKSTYQWEYYKDTHLRINLDQLTTRSREWAIFTTAVAYDTNIVIDNTNINKEKRAKYINYVKDKGYTIKCVWLTTPVSICKDRNASRDRVVPESAIDSFANSFEEPSLDEGFDEILCINNDGTTRKIKTINVSEAMDKMIEDNSKLLKELGR